MRGRLHGSHPGIRPEPEYESVLVAFEVSGYVPEVMATAIRMAVRRRRGIFVLVAIAVPSSNTLEEPMPEEESLAESVLEEARVMAGQRRVTGRWQKVRAGQMGRLIVEQAEAMHARAIVMPMPPEGEFGRTLKTVLRERPCRVLLESIPRGSR